jgi:hypothetical protein
MGRLVVLTVNFDTLLDGPASDVRVFATNEQFEQFPAYLDEYTRVGGPTPLLKLHGTIDVRASIVANVEDTLPGLEPARAAALTALMGKGRANVVYVGYSMRDLDLGPFLGQQVFGLFAEEMWVTPFPEGTVEAFAARYRTRNWLEGDRRSVESRTITQTSDSFIRQLSTAWSRP